MQSQDRDDEKENSGGSEPSGSVDEDSCLTDQLADPDGPVVCTVDYRRFLEWSLPVVDKATPGEESKVVSLQCWEILERVASRGFDGVKGQQLGAIELDWRSTGEGVTSIVWDLLVLEATIRRDHSGTLKAAILYRATRGTSVDYLMETDIFFAVARGQIISTLGLNLHAPAQDVTETLVEKGLLKIEMPLRHYIDHPSLERHRNALIGWHRAAYRTYFETTMEGRAAALTPRCRRFDDIHEWLDGVPHAPDIALLAAQLDRVEKIVFANQWTLICGFLAAVAVGVLSWIF